MRIKGTVSPASRDATVCLRRLTSLPAACQNRSAQLQSRVPTTAQLVTSLRGPAWTCSHGNRQLRTGTKTSPGRPTAFYKNRCKTKTSNLIFSPIIHISVTLLTVGVSTVKLIINTHRLLSESGLGNPIQCAIPYFWAKVHLFTSWTFCPCFLNLGVRYVKVQTVKQQPCPIWPRYIKIHWNYLWLLYISQQIKGSTGPWAEFDLRAHLKLSLVPKSHVSSTNVYFL